MCSRQAEVGAGRKKKADRRLIESGLLHDAQKVVPPVLRHIYAKNMPVLEASRSWGRAEKKADRRLIESGLLHDAQKVVLVDLAVAVPVRLVNHLLQLLISEILSQLLGNTLATQDKIGLKTLKRN
jgi:hypothetical protein